jgi:hypothetical protein
MTNESSDFDTKENATVRYNTMWLKSKTSVNTNISELTTICYLWYLVF